MTDQPICEKCGTALSVGSFPFCKGDPQDHAGASMAYKTAVFPFTVKHVDGKPMTIESLHHLRQVETKYGVAFSAFNQRNINDLDPIKSLPRFRGDDPDFERRR